MSTKASKPKTLEDLPQFTVTGIRRGATAESGYTHFELDGVFDRITETMDGLWFWLLYGERQCLCASLESLDRTSKVAFLTCEEESEPQVMRQRLACLSPYWQAVNVWMVLEPKWIWQREKLCGIDAVAEDYEAKEISIIDGREIKVWTKLEPRDADRGQSRYYPASDQTLPVRSGTRIVPSGWGHEHCELCRAHIDAGEFGYCDPSQHWLCEQCHSRYVVNHDLAFIDEL
ncbi:MAG: hypothetical protein WBY53_06075 [Acidobacteriaceae bacterium]